MERKGIGTAIEAVARLPDTDLVVAGGPGPIPRRRPAAGRADAARVADRVDFLARCRAGRCRPCSGRPTSSCACPWYEPFGIVPLEAMGCGVPVVASAVGGLVDTVVDGLTGRFVPPRDAASASAVIEELLRRPHLLREMGMEGTRRVRRRYSWTRVAGDTAEVYAAVVQEASSPAATVGVTVGEVGS